MSDIPDLVTCEELSAYETDSKVADFINRRHRAIVSGLFNRLSQDMPEGTSLHVVPKSLAVLKMTLPLHVMYGVIGVLMENRGEHLQMREQPQGWLCFFNQEQ